MSAGEGSRWGYRRPRLVAYAVCSGSWVELGVLLLRLRDLRSHDIVFSRIGTARQLPKMGELVIARAVRGSRLQKI